ncbi:MAG: ribonuclease domain-containing protein [Betaproteobacteria bacterium]
MTRHASAWLRAASVALALALGASGAAARDDRPPTKPIPEVSLSALPKEARSTLDLIKRGGQFPYRKDGTVFQNRERLLPLQPRGYYPEYTVPTPGERDRGARRIVAGAGAGGNPATSGKYYYTGDHYRSFQRIRE